MVDAITKGGAADYWNSNYTFVRSQSSMRKIIARWLNVRQLRKNRQLISVLLGAVAGTTATATIKRVTPGPAGSGTYTDKVPIETQNLVNRASTAADVTDLKAAFTVYDSRPTYPTDKARRF